MFAGTRPLFALTLLVLMLHPVGADDVADLIKGLKDPNAEARLKAVNGLNSQIIANRGVLLPEQEAAIPVLIGMLNPRQDYPLRAGVAALLANMSMSGKVKAAVPALLDEVKRKNVAAAYTLGKIGEEHPGAIPAKTALPILRAALKDTVTPPIAGNWIGSDKETKSRSIRDWACYALGSVGPDGKEALPDLQTALRDDSSDTVRSNAALALARMGVKEPQQVVPALVQSVKADKSFEVKRFAMAALSRLKPAGLAPLLDLAKDQDSNVRALAVTGLSAFGKEHEQAVIPVLAAATRDDVLLVRTQALGSLALIGPPASGALKEIGEALAREQAGELPAIFFALEKIGPPSLPILRKGLKNANPDIRGRAAACIGKIGPEARAAIPDLIELLKAPEKAGRLSAISALNALAVEGRAAVPALKALIDKDPEKEVRDAAAICLEKIEAVGER